MQFIETIYIGAKKKEQLLELPDDKSAYAHADKFFMLHSDAGSMHSDWSGPLLRIYFISSKKTGRRMFYTLEPVASSKAPEPRDT